MNRSFYPRWVTWAAFALAIAAPGMGRAQTVIAPLPPAAQEAFDKGIIAARVPDYLLAIRYFEDARKIAPAAPVIYLNLGLAESKIPGRELRAIAWFGAYLAANPDAPNAAAVKEQITVLDVRNQSNVLRFLTIVQDAARQLPETDLLSEGPRRSYGMNSVAVWWAKAGDISSALKAAKLVSNEIDQDSALKQISGIQAQAGDIAGALDTAGLIKYASYKDDAYIDIARVQAALGDISVAQKTAGLVQDNQKKIFWASSDTAVSRLNAGDVKGALDIAKMIPVGPGQLGALPQADALSKIVQVQLKTGDIAGAQKTATLIQYVPDRTRAETNVAWAQIKAGNIAGAQTTLAASLRTAALIEGSVYIKSSAYQYIVSAQAEMGDIASAQKTADLIQETAIKTAAQQAIARAQAKVGTANPPNSTPLSTAVAQPPIQPVKVSDWLKKLDDDQDHLDALKIDPHLDLPGYLKSLPPADNPRKVYSSLDRTAEKIVGAQVAVGEMLKRQFKK